MDCPQCDELLLRVFDETAYEYRLWCRGS
jgi:hypothetical protein